MVRTPDRLKETVVDQGSLLPPPGRQQRSPRTVPEVPFRTLIRMLSSTPVRWPPTVIGDETADPTVAQQDHFTLPIR